MNLCGFGGQPILYYQIPGHPELHSETLSKKKKAPPISAHGIGGLSNLMGLRNAQDISNIHLWVGL